MKYQYFSVKIYFVQPLMQSVTLTVLWFPLVVCKGTLVGFFFLPFVSVVFKRQQRASCSITALFEVV